MGYSRYLFMVIPPKSHYFRAYLARGSRGKRGESYGKTHKITPLTSRKVRIDWFLGVGNFALYPIESPRKYPIESPKLPLKCVVGGKSHKSLPE